MGKRNCAMWIGVFTTACVKLDCSIAGNRFVVKTGKLRRQISRCTVWSYALLNLFCNWSQSYSSTNSEQQVDHSASRQSQNTRHSALQDFLAACIPGDLTPSHLCFQLPRSSVIYHFVFFSDERIASPPESHEFWLLCCFLRIAKRRKRLVTLVGGVAVASSMAKSYFPICRSARSSFRDGDQNHRAVHPADIAIIVWFRLAGK